MNYTETFSRTVTGGFRNPEYNRGELSKLPVAQYSLDGELINVYPSYIVAARENEMNMICIYNCLKGRQGTSKGYVWKFATDEEIERIKTRESEPKESELKKASNFAPTESPRETKTEIEVESKEEQRPTSENEIISVSGKSNDDVIYIAIPRVKEIKRIIIEL